MILNKHDLRFKDKKRLARFFGLINHKQRLPGAGFAPTILNNLGAVEEFLAGRIPCVGIVDSNAPSANLMIPVPGNDDSGVCINFYCYILSKTVLAGKIHFAFL
jgi:ribosomal protein S2